MRPANAQLEHVRETQAPRARRYARLSEGLDAEHMERMGAALRLFLELLKQQTGDDGTIASGRVVTHAWISALVARSQRSSKRYLRTLVNGGYLREESVGGRGLRLWIAKPFRVRGRFVRGDKSGPAGVTRVAPLQGQFCHLSQDSTTTQRQSELALGPLALTLRSGTTSCTTSKVKGDGAPPRARDRSRDPNPKPPPRTQMQALEMALEAAADVPPNLREEAQRVALHWLKRRPDLKPDAIPRALEHFFTAARAGEISNAWGYLYAGLVGAHVSLTENALEEESRERAIAASRDRRSKIRDEGHRC